MSTEIGLDMAFLEGLPYRQLDKSTFMKNVWALYDSNHLKFYERPRKRQSSPFPRKASERKDVAKQWTCRGSCSRGAR